MSVDNNLFGMQNLNKIEDEEDTPRHVTTPCWEGQRKREHYVMATLAMALIVIFLLAFSLTVFIVKSKGGNNDNGINIQKDLKLIQNRLTPTSPESDSQVLETEVCLTKGCVKSAAAVINRLDETISPCEDFYNFACGNFLRRTRISEEDSVVSVFSQIEDQVDDQLRLIMAQKAKPSDAPSTKLVKDLYASCMDTEEIEAKGVEPLKAILRVLGGWPVVEGKNWTEENFSWLETVSLSKKLGYSHSYLFSFYIQPDDKNSSISRIEFDTAPLGLSREYLVNGINDSDVQAYLQYQIDIAVYLGADPDRAQEEMTEVLQLQIDLANMSMPQEEERNMTALYNAMTLQELGDIVPEIPWVEYVNRILPSPLEVNETELVEVTDMDYYQNLSTILNDTSKRVIANYLLWMVTTESLNYLSDDIRDIQIEYNNKHTGKTTLPPRWKQCVEHVYNELPYAVGNLYIKHFFDKTAKKEALELVNNLRMVMRNILISVDWMDNVTRERALEKADAMRYYVGFPDELLEDAKLTEYYSRLELERKRFMENIRRISFFETDNSLKELREPVDKLDWKRHSDVVEVNAYYDLGENAIQLPAAILQGAIFDADRPRYMNYAGVGFVIGHEITHAFDDEGKQYDYEGNLVNWWEPETEETFLEKAQCIIEQYGNFTVPENGMEINGITTQGENIADNGGIKEAYRAYKRWVKDNGKEKKLPGLDYSPNQMFWISSAQVWCTKDRPELLKLIILTDNHALPRFRINGPFSNSDEFANDWSCPVDSKMNPKEKCSVW